MRHTRTRGNGIFADVIEKIQMLTVSQQKFLQEMLAGREKVPRQSPGRSSSRRALVYGQTGKILKAV